MTAKELNRIFQKGECLSLDTMRLYIDGKLHKKSMHEVEKHLIECSLCSAAMDGLTPRRMQEINKLSTHIEKRLAVYMNTPPPVPFFRRFGLAIVTAMLLISGGTCWLLTHKSDTPKNVPGTESLPLNDRRPVTENTRVAGPAENSSPQENTPVLATSNDVSLPAQSGKTQLLPAVSPGQTSALTVKQDPPASAQQQSQPASSDPGPQQPMDGSNTRVAVNNAPLRIKSVVIYPPVTHNDGKGRKSSKDGQLGRTGGSDANFKMDEMPTYPGGDPALRAYLVSGFQPVNIDRSKVTRYSTGVRFVVNAKTGEVYSPEVSFSISPDVDAELLRVIKSMPDWNPGKKHGEVDIMIGVTFE